MLLSYVDNDDFLDNGDIWNFGAFAWAKLAGMTYVVLAKEYNPKDFQAQLTKLADLKINSSPELESHIHGDFQIQPLKEIHFGTNDFGAGPWISAVSPSWLWIFAAIGLIVLALACINFLNLSTAQAITRGREVGIRKSIGAQRTQLIFQFLEEAGILTILSAVVSVVIVLITLSSVNDLLGKQITFNPFDSPGLMGILAIGVIVTSVLAGIYPAWVISRFNPIATLKSNSKQGTGSAWLRKGLVITQFTISTALLLVVLVVSRQVSFMRNKDLGFDKDNIVTVEIGARNKAQAFANEISQVPGVKEVSLTRSSPISNDHWWNGMSLTKGSAGKTVCAIHGDEHFYSLFGLKLLSGRIPSSDINRPGQPSNQVVVNEKLLEDLALGTAAEAVGKHFWWGGDTEIVGVIADFNAEPLHYEIRPTIIARDTSVYSHLSIKLEAADGILPTLASIESSWRKAFPEGVYELKFLDSEINSFYQLETKLNALFKIFAGLAILISCLGLWGLVTFVAQQRTKEIGIRKVLGATVKTITVLLSRDFVLLVVTSILIATPLTYYLLGMLLQNFAYKVEIGWDVFVIAGISLLAIAIGTVSFQTMKAAMANPVKSLRSE
ncbi:MAG: FtsX-like permease family protein [Bacteroidota bacterium]